MVGGGGYRVRSTNGLCRYSFGNQLLIALQRPDAAYVAGFRAFLQLNRCVRKGDRAIRILAPMSLITRDADETQLGGEIERRRTVFRTVFVFDVAQADQLPDTQPVPLEPPSQPVTGDSHAHLLPALERLAGELGYTVTRRPLDGSADGWCDNTNHQIVVNSGLAVNRQVRVLIREMAHALGIGYDGYGRRRAEVLVDTVTHIVCSSVGLDTTGSTIPYIAGWGEDGALDAIRQYAETIDTIARRIEDAFER